MENLNVSYAAGAILLNICFLRGSRKNFLSLIAATLAVSFGCASNNGEILREGQKFRDCTRCPEMIIIPPGEFIMGSPKRENGRRQTEAPRHRVLIAKPFAVSRYEVTFDQWQACVGDGSCGGYEPDDEGWGRGRRPVLNVSWIDANTYVRWLSQTTGKPYRLLSEAEWEYAARAGTTTPFHFGEAISTGRANYDGRYTYGDEHEGIFRGQTVPVGRFAPNGFGLYDMHGNVWEWTQDCWNWNYDGAPTDGTSWLNGDCSQRVVRGGSWLDVPEILRSASRGMLEVEIRNTLTGGLRVARDLEDH